MKRITIITASFLSSSLKPCRGICMAVVLLFMLITSVGLANAQSKDRDSPTQLTSNEISGLIGDNKGDEYFYAFVAGPGEVTVTLTVEAGQGAAVAVTSELYDQNEKILDRLNIGTFPGLPTKRTIKRIVIKRKQQVLLRISIWDESLGSGRYRLNLDGAVDFNDSSIGIGGIGDVIKTYEPECLPKKGILFIKMKDGTRKAIDLSEVERITIHP